MGRANNINSQSDECGMKAAATFPSRCTSSTPSLQQSITLQLDPGRPSAVCLALIRSAHNRTNHFPVLFSTRVSPSLLLLFLPSLSTFNLHQRPYFTLLSNSPVKIFTNCSVITSRWITIALKAVMLGFVGLATANLPLPVLSRITSRILNITLSVASNATNASYHKLLSTHTVVIHLSTNPNPSVASNATEASYHKPLSTYTCATRLSTHPNPSVASNATEASHHKPLSTHTCATRLSTQRCPVTWTW